MIECVAISVTAYLMGSVPFGYLAGRIARVDVREHGSRNIGATNVLRVLGRKYGYFVFVADALKGFLAVRLTLWLADGMPDAYALGMLAAFAAVVGHSFPVWLRFHGGKGVATASGACAGLFPLATLVVATVWVITFLLFRFVSLASVAAAAALPVSVWVLYSLQGQNRPLLLTFAFIIAVLVIARHRGNIARLLRGTEPRFERK